MVKIAQILDYIERIKVEVEITDGRVSFLFIRTVMFIARHDMIGWTVPGIPLLLLYARYVRNGYSIPFHSIPNPPF